MKIKYTLVALSLIINVNCLFSMIPYSSMEKHKIEERFKAQEIFKTNLFDAIKENNIQQVKDLLEKNQINDLPNINNQIFLIKNFRDLMSPQAALVPLTPLAYAAVLGHIEIIKLLIQANLSSNDMAPYRHTPLMLAAKAGQKDAVLTLIKNMDIAIDYQNDDGDTALMLAAKEGHSKTTKILCKYANLELKNNDGNNAIMLAAAKCKKSVVKLMLDINHNLLNTVNNFNDNILISAMENKSTKIVKMLLKLNVNINHKNKVGNTPLMMAALYGQDTIINLLIQYGADLKQVNIFKYTPIDYATFNEHHETAQLLYKLIYGEQ